MMSSLNNFIFIHALACKDLLALLDKLGLGTHTLHFVIITVKIKI